MLQPQLQDHPNSSLIRPQREITEGDQCHGKHPQEHPPRSSPFLPRDPQTNPIAWPAATICAILLLIMILGGLIVLIVYLIYRPHSPLFDLNGATLNAASLDMGYLLNVDVSLLSNFTNPNKKVNIDFSHMYLGLYFENSLISTQYLEPFSAAKGETMFANIHMITSQVKLSMEETVLFRNQIANNQVMFTVKGVFRARSKLGGLFKYSYWLRGYCGIIVSSPPTGVLRERKCRTKH
ncbi:cytochrome P450 71B20-like [Hibiscus syriacus]|uniref:Cytochrome P450 71B20-like n=1 Tax=Hibiscus syriacus TaxID=106335 RepID=A0A6A2Z5X0_HIBSY|nr:NDR1/HIN1-like protein 2 [Hibiscus syriacus]KAE8687401.1 cytochrome P450 71B20-like [Hibiscus syriacus]